MTDKKTFMRKIKNTALIFTLLITGFQSNAQIEGILDAGIEDATKYLESYMEPAFVGIGMGINSGWYNTAKPHKFLGFDLTISGSAAQVPNANEFFRFRNSDYENIYFASGNEVDVPTLLGPNLGADDLPELTLIDPDTGDDLVRISAPTGLGMDETFPINAVPSPMIQVGVGIFKNTELKIRFIPESAIESLLGDNEDGLKYSMIGLGVMHDIKQWLPAEKILPIDLSLFVGFTKLEAGADLDADDPTSDQRTEFKATATTVQVIASRKVAFLTFFGGVGWTQSNVDFALKGTYDTETDILVDPVSFGYENSGMRANLGMRIKLLFLTLTGEYTIQEYNTISAGIGFTFN
jgi:uncharacterized protein DUF6588